jgi:hypothetical protein
MIVAIPSKGRAGRTTTDAFMTTATLFAPKSEVDDYKRAAKCKVVGIPNDVRGITRTRNWILDNCGDERVVFVDDDLEKAGWIEFFSHHVHYRELTPDEWLREFRRLFALTEQLGLSIFGVDTAGATRSTYPYKPFRFHTYLTASCMGVRNHVNGTAIRFDESFAVKEDYELCLRCIEKDGAVLAAQYVYWTNSHWTDAGGCADYRTQQMEEDAIKRLMMRYPRLVRRVTRGGSHYSIELDF